MTRHHPRDRASHGCHIELLIEKHLDGCVYELDHDSARQLQFPLGRLLRGPGGDCARSS